jgi:hypothetical protein
MDSLCRAESVMRLALVIAAVTIFGCGRAVSPYEAGLIGSWRIHLEGKDGSSLDLDALYDPQFRLRVSGRLRDAEGQEFTHEASGIWVVEDDQLTTHVVSSNNSELTPTGSSTWTIASLDYEELILSQGGYQAVYTRTW